MKNKTISVSCITPFRLPFLLSLLTAVFPRLGFLDICMSFRMFNENFSILRVYFIDNRFTGDNLICAYDDISVKEWPKITNLALTAVFLSQHQKILVVYDILSTIYEIQLYLYICLSLHIDMGMLE